LNALKILYLGSREGTSRHRCEALRRLGHEVLAYDPVGSIRQGRLLNALHYRTGYVWAAGLVRRQLLPWLLSQGASFDVIWVDNGDMIGARTLRELKPLTRWLVNYNCDDPTGKRDGRRWLTLLSALPVYDLCVVVRRESEAEYPRHGARRVMRVWRSADEVAHAPRLITREIQAKWQSQVAFVGTWMPERGPFMRELIRHGVPLSIWGNRWQKAPEWRELRGCWRGPALEGDDYAYAIQCAQINLGLLSKGNRDLHTTRSAEIPALGGLFCAERTVEHLALYQENTEALFWRDALECSRVTKQWLENPADLSAVAKAGRARLAERDLWNESVLRSVLSALSDR